ncbi:hypothetical protein Q3G72_005834 [Acer saccharum]|nr:hypothetical protein Q3G72_005834 [Acer saccharum]
MYVITNVDAALDVGGGRAGVGAVVRNDRGVPIFAAVTQILFVFVKSFNKSREENERLADAEKKKLEKEAMKEKAAANLCFKKDGDLVF